MRRLGLPLVVAFCGALPLGLTLMQRVPTDWQERLITEWGTRPNVPVEMITPPATELAAGIPISARDQAWLTRADAVHLWVHTYGTSPTLSAARLRAQDGTCEFAAAPGTRLVEDNTMLVLDKTHCEPHTGPRAFELRVRGEAGRLALWTYSVEADDPDARMVIRPNEMDYLAPRGVIHIPGDSSQVRRIDQVAFAWNHRTRTIALWLLVLGSAAVFAAWVLGTTRGTAGAVNAVRVALAGGLMALSVAGTWAVVIPPLQGADEPDHLLSFATVVGAPQVRGQLEWLARHTHFERIRFHGDERLRPIDRQRPNDPPWTGDIHEEQMERRSPVAAWLWRVAGTAGLRTLQLPNLLLALRVADAAVFAGTVVLALGFAWWGAGGRTGAWMIVGLVLIPTLPYFATVVSDWAFVASWGILMAAAVVVLQNDGPRSSWAGAALGLGFALLLGTSISALAVGPFLLLLLCGRVGLGPSPADSARNAWRAAATFWGGIAAGTALAYAFNQRLLQAGYARYDATSGTGAALLGKVNEVLGGVALHPWLLVLPLAALMIVEVLGARIRRVEAVARMGRRVALIACTALALWIVATLVSVTSRWPTVPFIEVYRFESVQEYVAAVLAAAATVARLRGPDHLTFTSLWSGFGWIDTILPAPMLGALAGLSAAAVIGSIWWWHRVGRSRQLGWLAIGVAGGLLSLTAYAIACYYMRRNIHGRYLIGLAIPLLAFVTAGAGRAIARSSLLTRSLVVITLVAIHGFSLAFVVARYY